MPDTTTARPIGVPSWTSDDHPEQRAEIRALYARELEPVVRSRDEAASIRDLIPVLGQHGLLGTMIPKAYGGSDEGLVRNTVIAGELAGVSPSLAAMRSVSVVFATIPLLHYGSEEQKTRWLPDLASGATTAALAITEPNAGSDAGGMAARATRHAGGYRISGTKLYTSGSWEAEVILAYCVTDPAAPVRRRFSAFLIPVEAIGKENIEPIPTLGLRGLSHSKVVFDDVAVGPDALLSAEGDGYGVMMYGLTPERIDIASRAVGCAARAYREALTYAATREQFGKAISEFQAVTQPLADARCELEAAQLLTTSAARMFDAGQQCDHAAAMAKLYAANKGFGICDVAMQVSGARGYSKASPIETMLRDVRALRFGGGTDEVMRHVVQREEFKLLGAVDRPDWTI